jgi:hypothetical protein
LLAAVFILVTDRIREKSKGKPNRAYAKNRKISGRMENLF